MYRYRTIYSVLIINVSRDGTARTWRRPAETRVAAAVAMTIFPVLPGWWLGETLVTSHVPNGGWIALELSLAAWGILAWRALVHSVTLTRDTLVIRNFLRTRRVRLADATGVGFRRGALKVTTGHGGVAGQRFTISVGGLGSTYWSGLRSEPDTLAEALCYAAGLPTPPSRREIISRNWSWVLLAAAAACFGLGLYAGPVQSMRGASSLALGVAGGMLYGLGLSMLVLAIRIVRDHRRKRAQQAVADGWSRGAA
jgi:hypothetical protein